VHSLLKRQLKKYLSGGSVVPEQMKDFINSVDQAYRQFDEDREMLERSLELSSQELMQANSEMRATLQAFPDLVFSVDRDGIIGNIKAGSNVKVLLKHSDYLGRRIQDIPSKEIADKFSEALEQVAETGNLVRIEYELGMGQTKRNPRVKQFYEARLLPITDKQIFVIIRNITKSKRAQLALVEEKERLAVTLRSIVDGVVTTDTDGRVVMMNKALEEMTGWRQTEAYGRHCTEVVTLVGDRDNAPLKDTLDRAFLQKNIVNVAENLTLIGRNHKKNIVAMSVAPIMDQNGRLYGAILVVRDMAEKLKLEEELIKSERMESIGILAGGIAHDFNNVLGAILGNISLAKMYLDADEKSRHILERAEKASNRAKELTQQLLTFSKGGAPIKKASYLPEMLKETVLFMLSGSKVRSEFEIQSNLWLVDIDKGQICQVINNLVINAVQAMPAGGLLKVSAENALLADDDRRDSPAGFVRIDITDNGTGIERDKIPHIFEPYYTTKKDGSGLGLATSYSIIQKHGGRIEAASEVGVGTTFTLLLPVSQEDNVEGAGIEGYELQGEGRILVMDDDETILEVMHGYLEFLGYDDVCVKNGEAAIQAYKEALRKDRPFTAVIMDLTVPGGKGGKEVLEDLLKIDKDVRAIVSSGYSQDSVMSDFRQYGFKGVLLKPYSVENFARILSEVVNA
jgi:PAS domain S-box-containing protein